MTAGMKENLERRKAYLECIAAMDDVMSCVPEFRLDFWESQGRAKAGERGARAFRRMFTTWNDPNRPTRELNDYTRREYAGLLRGYYMKRWEIFFGLSDDKGEFGEDAYKAALREFEIDFWKNGTQMSPMPHDDLAALAKAAKAALQRVARD